MCILNAHPEMCNCCATASLLPTAGWWVSRFDSTMVGAILTADCRQHLAAD